MPRLSTAYRAWIPLRWCDLLATRLFALFHAGYRFFHIQPASCQWWQAGVGGGTRARRPPPHLYVPHTQQRLFFTIYTQSPHVVNLFRPIEYLTRHILQTVQLSNRRNGDGELGYFPVFMPRLNETAGELLTHCCTFQMCVPYTRQP